MTAGNLAGPPARLGEAPGDTPTGQPDAPGAWLPARQDLQSGFSGLPARFLATMSHELRNPLNAVIGFSDAIMRPAVPPLSRDQVVEYAAAVNGAGRQLLTLVDVILDVARAEMSPSDVPADLMDVGHLISSAVSQAAENAQAGEVALHSQTPPGLPLLRGDERRIRQTLSHLLGNAIKFTPRGGAARIAARLDLAGNLLLLVSDTGIGIDEADIPRAFEPFVQLDSSNARRFAGSGLGLYIARSTARAHGGDILLSSQPGVGTTAVLKLPAERLVAPQNRPQT